MSVGSNTKDAYRGGDRTDLADANLQIEKSLRIAGVRRSRLKRVLNELEDHEREIRLACIEGGMDSSSSEGEFRLLQEIRFRMGCPEAIVAAVVSDPRSLQWARRLPWIVYVVLPFVVLQIGFLLSGLMLIVTVEFVAWCMGVAFVSAEGSGYSELVETLAEGANWIIPSLAAAMYCAVAFRARQSNRWLWLVAALLTISVSVTQLVFESNLPEWSPSLALNIDHEMFLDSPIQSLLPLFVIAGFVIFRSMTWSLRWSVGRAGAV